MKLEYLRFRFTLRAVAYNLGNLCGLRLCHVLSLMSVMWVTYLFLSLLPHRPDPTHTSLPFTWVTQLSCLLKLSSLERIE